MTAVNANASHLRPVDVRTDLWAIADLIELCFSGQMDSDGREYVRHLRRTAQNPENIHMIPGSNEQVSSPLSGYVWVEDGRIVGNLTLIPFYRGDRWLYLICNVAVHPDYRLRGIAQALTQAGIQHVSDQRAYAVWLQVRSDNPGAVHLYRKLGFRERATRTTWVLPDILPLPPRVPLGYSIVKRRNPDWPLQQAWLNNTYPPAVTWNLSLDEKRFSPGILRSLERFLAAETLLQWSVLAGNTLCGVLSWEPHPSQEMIWPAVNPEFEPGALLALLSHLRRENPEDRRLTVNYPAGRAVSAFEQAGFYPLNTLIWMEIPFKEVIHA